ncbi:MAG: hypothetical protein ACT4PO_16505, partial [Actinomycetota bacterium]
VRSLLGEPPKKLITDEAIEDNVAAAVRRFSGDSPRVTFTDFSGNGSAFDFALPTGWIHGFSRVSAIEHPTGNRPETFLDLKEIITYPRDSAPTVIRLLETTPATGTNNVRVYWTLPWPIPTSDATVDKIADHDFEPVAHLGAYLCCLQLESQAAANTRLTVPTADFAGQGEESGRWKEAGDRHLKAYLDHIGGGLDGAVGPADGLTDWDARSSWLETGRRFLFRLPRR